MKKIAPLLTVIGSLVATATAYAADPTPVNVNLRIPQSGINPGISIGTLLSNALTIVFIAAALIVLFMLVIGAFQWITSGGDKEAVGKARGRITSALIGLAILALAFLITRVVGQVVNIDILNLKFIPTLDQCPAGQVIDPSTGGCITPRPTLAPGQG